MERIETEEEYDIICAQLHELFMKTPDGLPLNDPQYIEIARLGDLIDEYDDRMRGIRPPKKEKQ